MEGQLPTNQSTNKGFGIALLILALLIIAGVAFWLYWGEQRATSVTKTGAPKTEAPATKPETTTPTANEQKAITLVKARREMQTWLKLFPGSDMTSLTTGGHAIVEADHEEDGVITVHIYEQLIDHTATFGWYSVDTKTWKVTKDL